MAGATPRRRLNLTALLDLLELSPRPDRCGSATSLDERGRRFTALAASRSNHRARGAVDVLALQAPRLDEKMTKSMNYPIAHDAS